MKHLRSAGMTFLLLAMAALVFLPGPPASGQSAPAGSLDNGNTFYHALQNHNIPFRLDSGGQDPEMHKLLSEEGKLEREVAGLRREYARLENEKKRAEIKAKLADLLNKQFDVQQNRRDVELTRLEAKVK